ncbi:unnamed protein product [Effrenium voratum]|nr:unnamed protein product [Effrenium voratum]
MEVTESSGRLEVLRHVASVVQSSRYVVELGCGTGLLAREAARPDIVGVDMCSAMVKKACSSSRMDTALVDNILEFYPVDSPDAVVLCNVLEPYSSEVRKLLFSHIMDFLSPGGLVVVAVMVGKTGLGTEFESVLDLVFPSANPVHPGDIEEELAMIGFDVAVPELISVRRDQAAVLHRPCSLSLA